MRTRTKDSGFALPLTIYERAPIEPGIIPNSSKPARIAPFLVTKGFHQSVFLDSHSYGDN